MQFRFVNVVDVRNIIHLSTIKGVRFMEDNWRTNPLVSSLGASTIKRGLHQTHIYVNPIILSLQLPLFRREFCTYSAKFTGSTQFNFFNGCHAHEQPRGQYKRQDFLAHIKWSSYEFVMVILGQLVSSLALKMPFYCSLTCLALSGFQH